MIMIATVMMIRIMSKNFGILVATRIDIMISGSNNVGYHHISSIQFFIFFRVGLLYSCIHIVFFYSPIKYVRVSE